MNSAYDLQGLESLDGSAFPVSVSSGGTFRGRSVAQRAARTVEWLDRSVGMPKAPPLFVFGPAPWTQLSAPPPRTARSSPTFLTTSPAKARPEPNSWKSGADQRTPSAHTRPQSQKITSRAERWIEAQVRGCPVGHASVRVN